MLATVTDSCGVYHLSVYKYPGSTMRLLISSRYMDASVSPHVATGVMDPQAPKEAAEFKDVHRSRVLHGLQPCVSFAAKSRIPSTYFHFSAGPRNFGETPKSQKFLLELKSEIIAYNQRAVLCWYTRGLLANKSRHRPRHDLIPRALNRTLGCSRLIHVTRDR